MIIRTEGIKGVPLVECINFRIGKYRIRWDIQQVEGKENLISYYETDMVLPYKPRVYDVKQAILSAINKDIDEQIVTGFIWKDMSIWLSNENQFNYKAAYDLTLQSEGKTLPALFKFGTTDNPIYYSFVTIEELSDFYIGAMRYISDTLVKGWAMKDSIDWSLYEEALKTI